MNRPTALHPRLDVSLGMAVATLSGLTYAADEVPNTLQLQQTVIDAAQDNGTPYQTERLSGSKFTEALRDTPQSISVVPKRVLQEQNAQDLKDVLRNVPGITFNSGEGGGGVGDSINIRGFNADGNIYRDGVRDPAKYTHSELFNTEQVEVLKGSSSSGWGVGAIGGAVNLVTKTPELKDFNTLDVGVGTADYKRSTLDINHTIDGLGEGAAFRLNVVGYKGGVNGRDWIQRERNGFAPSLALGLGTDTRFTLAYEYLHDNGNTDYGIPTVNGTHGSAPHRLAGWNSYWGWRNLDKENNESHRLNLKFAHDFNDTVSFDNQLTYFHLDHDYFVTTPGGTYYGPNSPAPGVHANKGVYRRTINTPSRDQTNATWSDQSNLTFNFDTYGIGHTLVTGVEYSKQTLQSNIGKLTAADATQMNNLTSASNTWSKYPYSADTYTSSEIAAEQVDKAFYVLDTLKFDEHWQLHLAGRQDHYESRVTGNYSRSSQTAAWVDGGNSSASEKINSVHTALVYKPVENGSIYLSYANARQPNSLTAIAQTGSNTGDSTQRGKTYELGTKWDLFDENLSLTAALYETKRSLTYTDDDTGATLDVGGEQRVRGLELGVAGNITEHWSIYAGYAFQDSKTLKAANEGSDDGVGIANTPKHTLSVWNTWKLPGDNSLSYGVRYVDTVDIYQGTGTGADSVTSSATKTTVPDYVVHDMAFTHAINRDMDVRLNITNLFNKHYWSEYNGRGYGLPGDGRGATVTGEYRF
ncbi:MAG: TonB-dependent siderophore receptor [Pseudomonas sp.]|uniref:TonB-dependent receptor n=1 Tax=Pseudomonas abieticivorans TaxID=2931382 RepID=UPI0020BDC5B6|nr:TonB-dependent siderophore receptor [Pseudomonas sp. PIA16]MDE1167236.1 TonB-dependent siderophore receptor [Pseudomonas sp.]